MEYLKKIKTGVLFFLLIISITTACTYKKGDLLPTGCSTVNAKFGADVLPLITSKCALPGCHDASASGNMIFQNYTQISNAKNRINIRAIVEKSMPETGPLSQPEIDILKCWIESGAPNN